MCPWVGPHAPLSGLQLWGLPSCVEYLSPKGVLLPLVYSTTASPLWLELRGLSAWQVTTSWTVYRLACQRLLTWLQVTFAMVPDAASPESDQWALGYRPCCWPGGSAGSPQCARPMGCWFFSCPSAALRVHVCAVSWTTWLHVHRCARSVRCFACAVSWATWLPFTGVPAWCVVLLVRCPGPLGSCSPVCPRGVLCCVCGVLGHLAPVHRCAPLVHCFACAVSWATWLLLTGARSVCCLCVRCPGPLGSCSPVCPLGVLCCVCGVLGHLAPVHRCACSVRCLACEVSWAASLLFTSLPALCVALRVRCPG